jgi:type I restriction-modification system DNA methylase subunit
MWLFTRYGFFSIASGTKLDGSVDPKTIMIRSRSDDHLKKLQKRFLVLTGKIKNWRYRDYRYRLIVLKAVWVKVMAELAEEQEWSNFKDEAKRFQGEKGQEYVHTLHRVYIATLDLELDTDW